MKRFALWLFKIAYRREIAQIESQIGESSNWMGADWDDGWDVGVNFALNTLQLTKQEK